MANDKSFKVKNGLQAGRYLHQSSPLVDPYEGVTIRPVFHYDMIANVFTADLQLDDISFAGELYTSSTLEPWDTTIVDTPISNYSSASWFPVNTNTLAGRVNRDSGGTPSTGTGRTDAVSDSYYLYFETTSPANSVNYDFLLRGEEHELTATPTFSFYEARNGTNLGNLNVYVDVVESPWASIPVGLTSQLLQTTGDVDAWVQKTVPMDLFYRPPGSKVVDLKRAHHFNHTLTENTTLYFENPPPSGSASSFALEITGADVASPYDLDNGVKLSPEHSFSHRNFGLSFKPDGTKLYVNSHGSSYVYEYSLSTAWDITTLSQVSSRYIGTTSWSLHFKPDGTKFYTAGSGEIKGFSMSTPWDLSTASSEYNYNFPSAQDSGTVGVFFSSDGTALFMIGYNNRIVYKYTPSTAWSLSSVSYASVSFDASSEVVAPGGLFFTADGLQMYIPCYSTEKIYKYALSTAWDITTASYTGTSLDVASVDTDARGIWIKPDGTRLYMNGDVSDKLYEFDIAAAAPATVTYPSSVKWSGATTPDAPAAGEKDLYVFVTTDGGTTYYGKQAGDALA